MEIGNERTDVAQAVRMSAILPVLFQMLDVPPRAGVPEMHVPFVDAVNLSARRRANIFVGKKKLAQAWIERESMNAVSGGVNHHRARAVDKIARSDLVRALLQAVFERAVFVIFGDLVMDGKDRSNTGVDIDIGRSVQGIEHQNVFAPRAAVRNRNDILGFFGSHDTQVPVVAHCAANGLLRKLVEFLDGFAVNVHLAGFSKNLDEPRFVDLPRNDLRCQRERGQESREIAGGSRVHPLFVQDVLLDCLDLVLHGSKPYNGDGFLANSRSRPSPFGKGRREAPGEGSKSSQILKPSPRRLPEGEGHGKSNKRNSQPADPVPVNHNSSSSLTPAPSPSSKISPLRLRSPRTTWIQARRPVSNIRLMDSPGASSVTYNRAS